MAGRPRSDRREALKTCRDIMAETSTAGWLVGISREGREVIGRRRCRVTGTLWQAWAELRSPVENVWHSTPAAGGRRRGDHVHIWAGGLHVQVQVLQGGSRQHYPGPHVPRKTSSVAD